MRHGEIRSAALFLFGVTGLVAISGVPNKAAALRAVLHWLLGFVALVVVVLFAQLVVFEWLKWNGTTTNDWFLWCGGSSMCCNTGSHLVGAWRIIRVGSQPELLG